MNRYIYASVLAVLLLSCQKKSNNDTGEAVTINIQSPTTNFQYKKGDTVRIMAEISSGVQLHGYIIQLTDDRNNIIFDREGHTHNDKILLDEYWVDTLSYPTRLSLTLTAVIDHDNNKYRDSVFFNSQP